MANSFAISGSSICRVVEGCELVLHLASPFPAGAVASPDDLIRTAKDGTLNVLKACSENGRIKRVVLTSSMLAVSSKECSEVS